MGLGRRRQGHRELRLIDAHGHLDFPVFDGRRDGVIARARDRGVAGVVVPGIGPEQWPRGAAVRDAHPDFVVGLGAGFHPCFLPEGEPDLRALEQALAALGVTELGECGLDRRAGDLPRQERWLRAQLDLAQARDLPVCLHVVRAHGRMLAILEGYSLRGFVHGFSGSADLVPRYLSAGLDLGFGKSVLRAGKARSAALATPAGRRRLESDAPDQLAEPADVARVDHALGLS